MTTYLVQKVGAGQPPKSESQTYYELVYKTDDRAEALHICKYETQRTKQIYRVVTMRAWEQQSQGQAVNKRGAIVKAKTRQPITARVESRGAIVPSRYYKQATPKQLRTRTNRLYKMLKAIW